jgi:hypothetical protein
MVAFAFAERFPERTSHLVEEQPKATVAAIVEFLSDRGACAPQ